MSPSPMAPRMASVRACNADVGVRVALEPMRVRNLHPAQPNVIAGREGVHVEAAARSASRAGRAGSEKALGERDILGRRQLHVAARACHELDGKPGPLGKPGIVGEARLALLGGAAVGGEDRREVEGLRRLRAPQVGAVDGFGDRAVGRGALQRIGDRLGRDGRRRLIERGKQAA